MTWDTRNGRWEYAANWYGGGSGVTTVGTFSGTSQTNGASISGSTITFGPADATNPGMVSTGTQTFAGSKTFSSAPTLSTMTSGSVLFAGASGVVSQDNSNLYYDDTNNRLSIGTSSSINGTLTISRDNTDYTNTSGAGSVLQIKNPNASGQNVVYNEINGVMKSKWRTDNAGNINWVSAANTNAQGHYFFVGGDYGSGEANMYITNAGTRIGNNLTVNQAVGKELEVLGSASISSSLYVGATSSANSTIESGGSFGAAIATTSTNLTLDATHYTVIVTSGTPTITLPAAASGNSRRIYVVVNQTGSGVTISSYLDFTGAGNTTVAANSAIKIQSNGSNWYRIL